MELGIHLGTSFCLFQMFLSVKDSVFRGEFWSRKSICAFLLPPDLTELNLSGVHS